jgi:predicted porin
VSGDKQKTWNIGGSWDFGFAKLMGYYDQEKLRRSRKTCGRSAA